MRHTNKERPTILITATLDTKGDLAKYLKYFIEINGASGIIMDVGFRGKPTIDADISRHQIAIESGKEIIEGVTEKCDCMEIVSEGARVIVERMIENGTIKGIIGIGGCIGTYISSNIMNSTPIGFPKVIVSTIPYDIRTTIGSTDVMFMYSVVDVLGLNPLVRTILEGAVGSVLGRINLKHGEVEEHGNINVGITALGITTRAADFLNQKLSRRGFEVTVFHANGNGGAGFETAAKNGFFDAIIDLTTHEINHILFDTPVVTKNNRLLNVTSAKVPYIFVPGGLDLITQGPIDTLPQLYKKRPHYQHSHAFTHVRISIEEAEKIAIYVAARINKCTDRAGVCIPLKGFSEMNREGSHMYDRSIDQVFINVLKQKLDSHVAVREVDAHINDEAFADAICQMLLGFKLKLIIK